MLANIVQSTFSQSNLIAAESSLTGDLAAQSHWTDNQGPISFYQHWSDKPDAPEPDFTTHTDITETTRDVAPEETLTKEPSADELKDWMDKRPLEDFDSSWHQYMDIMVVPLTLQEYWDAFWADDAPYFIGAYGSSADREMTSCSDWSNVALSLEYFHIHEQADITKTVTRKLKGNGWSTHTGERDDFYLLE